MLWHLSAAGMPVLGWSRVLFLPARRRAPPTGGLCHHYSPLHNERRCERVLPLCPWSGGLAWMVVDVDISDCDAINVDEVDVDNVGVDVVEVDEVDVGEVDVDAAVGVFLFFLSPLIFFFFSFFLPPSS